MARIKPNSTAVAHVARRSAVIFAVVLLLMGLAIVATTRKVIIDEIDAEALAELEILAQLARDETLPEVSETVRRMALAGPERHGFVSLFDAQGQWLAGPMKTLPADAIESGRLRQDGRRFLIKATRTETATIVVARSLAVLGRAERHLAVILPSAALALFAALLVAATLGEQAMARQLDALDETLRDFARGDRSARVPLGRAGDRMHDVGSHVNQNLAHLSTAIETVENTSVAIAHDLRTPLTRASLAIQTAVEDPAMPAPLADRLAGAGGDLDQLRATFDTILRIARINAAGQAGLAVVDLVPLLTDLAETYGAVCEDAGLVLVAELPEAPLLVAGDLRMLGQAVVNLLENAVKYAGTGATVRLLAGPGPCMTVADNGPGVPADQLEAIFAPFARVDQSRGRPGVGLGLALVRAIAEHHGGTVAAGDAGPGLAVTLTLRGPEAA